MPVRAGISVRRSSFPGSEAQPQAAGPADAGWAYWRPAVDGAVELGTLAGRSVALPTHFHAEDQVTFVLSGRRRFLVAGVAVELAAGQGALIPAGTAHRSLPEPAGVACLNAYLPTGGYDVAAMLRDLRRAWRMAGGRLGAEALAAVASTHRQGDGAAAPPPGPAPFPCDADCRDAVAEAAAWAGMSREGFTRMFAKRHGMSPHAFWLVARLNRARGLLRAGERIAAVAAETGFADQSHLGRWFRRAFGVSPGRYRAGWLP